ncbi:hypothetical protein M3Y98_00942000 [Aphelenchoides besseyi]|nr:hypothetical protein M3Y98_00942000 [Aphelenchoides besseyi]KAI6194346.1 hypothetical protein M3Y96_01115200 [Aphelenchoides besseyi]
MASKRESEEKSEESIQFDEVKEEYRNKFQPWLPTSIKPTDSHTSGDFTSGQRSPSRSSSPSKHNARRPTPLDRPWLHHNSVADTRLELTTPLLVLNRTRFHYNIKRRRVHVVFEAQVTSNDGNVGNGELDNVFTHSGAIWENGQWFGGLQQTFKTRADGKLAVLRADFQLNSDLNGFFVRKLEKMVMSACQVYVNGQHHGELGLRLKLSVAGNFFTTVSFEDEVTLLFGDGVTQKQMTELKAVQKKVLYSDCAENRFESTEHVEVGFRIIHMQRVARFCGARETCNTHEGDCRAISRNAFTTQEKNERAAARRYAFGSDANSWIEVVAEPTKGVNVKVSVDGAKLLKS